MRLPDDAEVVAWLEKSRGDLRMCSFALDENERLWDQACYHAQQAAEKCLKALLVAMDEQVPRSHDLVFLMERITQKIPSDSSLVSVAATLVPYSVSARYPTFLTPEDREEALEAHDAAVAICGWVREKIGSG